MYSVLRSAKKNVSSVRGHLSVVSMIMSGPGAAGWIQGLCSGLVVSLSDAEWPKMGTS